jgi:hypothetical protein
MIYGSEKVELGFFLCSSPKIQNQKSVNSRWIGMSHGIFSQPKCGISHLDNASNEAFTSSNSVKDAVTCLGGVLS